jgi:hypothetical protein
VAEFAEELAGAAQAGLFIIDHPSIRSCRAVVMCANLCPYHK